MVVVVVEREGRGQQDKENSSTQTHALAILGLVP